jgi:hypothetical protein
MLTIELGNRTDLLWAQDTVAEKHYLHQPVDPRARPMAYVIRHDDFRVGLVMLGIPHATKCTGWWGYPGLPTQWQVVDICRIWIHPDLQAGGFWCELGEVPGFVDRHGQFRPTVALDDLPVVASVPDTARLDQLLALRHVYQAAANRLTDVMDLMPEAAGVVRMVDSALRKLVEKLDAELTND